MRGRVVTAEWQLQITNQRQNEPVCHSGLDPESILSLSSNRVTNNCGNKTGFLKNPNGVSLITMFVILREVAESIDIKWIPD